MDHVILISWLDVSLCALDIVPQRNALMKLRSYNPAGQNYEDRTISGTKTGRQLHRTIPRLY